MTKEIQSSKQGIVYDLEERTALFGESVIDFIKGLGPGPANRVLAHQLIRSATSVGANYLEADVASSKRDFKFKISLCRKEAKESRHWLRMIIKANASVADQATQLRQEALELVLIFSAILKK